MTSQLDPWQRPDGFPSDTYFKAVVDALNAAGIPVKHSSREEDWEFVIELDPSAYASGPLSWAEHGLYVSWRCDDECEPGHADDFDGLGWFWVPYSRPHTAAGDFVRQFPLPFLAEPGEVAAAVAALVREETPVDAG